MTPAQFLSRMKKKELAPAYLFVGVEAYQRRACREALLRAALGDADRDNAVTRYDLNEVELAEVIDDARSLSLFASDRVILVRNADAALPKGRVAEEPDEETHRGQGSLLAGYLRDA